MFNLARSQHNCNLQFSREAVKTLAGALCNPSIVEKVGVLNALAVKHARYTKVYRPNQCLNKVEYISTQGADIIFRFADGPTVIVDAYTF